MQYRIALDIILPRERVVELFLDVDSLKKWQPDLVSFEHLSNYKTRRLGSKSRQIHKMGSREVEIIETITIYDSPERFSATYEADGVWNLVENQFIDVAGRKTRWILDTEFKCSGMMKFMGFLLPGMFKKQTATFMSRFKAFAEDEGV